MIGPEPLASSVLLSDESTPILEAEGVTVRFGGTLALSGVGLSVLPGQIHGLIGPNGAGKTTLLNVLSGFLRPGDGTVRYAGRDITKIPPARRFRMGLARTFQRPELFGALTVREHLEVARRSARLGSAASGKIVAQPDELLDTLGLAPYANRLAGALPLGTARLVEIGRALAGTPRVVLLDEPSSGLDSAESEILSAALRRVRDGSAVAFVLVEHDVELVMSLSDRIDVLDFGASIGSGTPKEIRDDPRVRRAYLGDPPVATAG
jgi:ABC-type branched-subunit amino acid transport system ATPase component